MEEGVIGEESDRSLLLPNESPTLFTYLRARDRQVFWDLGASQQPTVKVIAQCLGSGFIQAASDIWERNKPGPRIYHLGGPAFSTCTHTPHTMSSLLCLECLVMAQLQIPHQGNTAAPA